MWEGKGVFQSIYMTVGGAFFVYAERQMKVYWPLREDSIFGAVKEKLWNGTNLCNGMDFLWTK